jgi:hypothetical protein
MNDIVLKVVEKESVGSDPEVTLVLTCGDEEVLRRDARLFSEDDFVAACNEITRVSGFSQPDMDQQVTELIESLRKKRLQKQEPKPEENGSEEPEGIVPRYIAVLPQADADGPTEPSMRDAQNDRILANFVLTLDEDIEVQDDVESWREFAGTLTTASGTSPFRIKATDFADNKALQAALFAAGGCELLIYAKLDELRRAISMISKDAGKLRRRKLTTNFGWTADGSSFLTPSVCISAKGIEELDDQSEVRVDLHTETPACCLDLKKLEDQELRRLKQHVVDDLLKLSDRTVTYTLLGATAASVLYPFAKGAGRFALWLVGKTGAGKSFVSKLFSNFFGNFPIASAPFTTWSGTPNYVQRQGYFFKDALYLVDDYKPEVVPAYQVVRILQSYADNTARGRLKSDASANVLRPIRGFLVCTGEDVPEHNASAIARSVIVQVPQQAKKVAAGSRCLVECEHYCGVMAGFIRWLLAEGRPGIFAQRFGELQTQYYQDVVGQQNDIRVATNLALLGAAFEQFAEYLGDVWPGWQQAVKTFLEEDLVAIRTAMLGEAREQQASEVFLRTLADLIQFGHVRIDALPRPHTEAKPLIGQAVESPSVPVLNGLAAQRAQWLELSMDLALAEVNKLLRAEGRPELKTTHRALLQQLREDGKLLDQEGQPLTDPKAEVTYRTRLLGQGQRRVFAIRRGELLGDG